MIEYENERVAAAFEDLFRRYRQMTREERIWYIAALRRLVEPRGDFAPPDAPISMSNVVQFPRLGGGPSRRS